MRIGVRGLAAVAAAVAIVVAAGWWLWSRPTLPAGISQANGRLESEQTQVAAKFAGRVDAVLVREGDQVDAGEVIARTVRTRATTVC